MCIGFRSIQDLNDFKHKSSCNDFYINREALTLVGKFTQIELDLAISYYNGFKENSEDI